MKPKERPLAARRQHVQSLTPTKIDTVDSSEAMQSDVVEKVETPIKPNTDDPEIESLDEALVRSQKSKSESTPKKEIVYSKKTMKEIEAEVAQNTAAFDKGTLKSSTAEKDKKVIRKLKFMHLRKIRKWSRDGKSRFLPIFSLPASCD